VSKAVRTLELELPRERALAACRTAIAGLNWELVEAGADWLSGRQDPARLCCRSAPVRVEIELSGASDEPTRVDLRGSVPGFGPIASRDLRSALVLLEAAIRRSLAAPIEPRRA
jgi:hypothetical protein